MATIKIIDGTGGGSFPAQKAQLMLGQLTIRTIDRGKKIYPIATSVLSFQEITANKKECVFNIMLTDGCRFRGESDLNTAYELKKHAGGAANIVGIRILDSGEVSKQTTIASIIGMLLFILVLYQCSGESSPPPAKHSNAQQENIIAQQANISPAQQRIENIKGLETFLKESEEHYARNKAEQSDFENIRKTLSLFSGMAEYLHEAKSLKAEFSTEEAAYFKNIEKRLSSLQQRTLPGLRKAYSKGASSVLWEHNVQASVSGDRNTTITFVGGLFAANSAIKQTQEQVGDMLIQLRFRYSKYQWYKGADGWRYDLKPPKDAEIRLWKFGSFQNQ